MRDMDGSGADSRGGLLFFLRRGSPLARISHHPTAEARNRPAITALRLLAVLNVLFEYARIVQEERHRASRALY